MKKLIVSLALGASVLAAAAPASAQYYGRDRYEDRYDRGDRGDRWDRGDRRWGNTGFHPQQLRPRMDRINFAISRGVQRGAITRGEAARLNYEQRQIWDIATNYYRSGGVDRRELREIEDRVARLQDRVRWERQDGDRRYWR